MNILVDPDFAAIMPPHTGEEASALAASLSQEGCRDPLIVWDETSALLDGHQRKGICERLGIPFGIKRLKFADRGAAMIWIIQNQFARRNLTPFQRAELALKLEPLIAARAVLRMRKGGRVPLGKGETLPGEAIRTRAILGTMSGTSGTTIGLAKVILKEADEKTLDDLRTGKASVKGTYQRLRNLTKYQDAEQTEIVRLQSSLEEIRSYEPPMDETPRQTVDKLQHMAAVALESGTVAGAARVGTYPAKITAQREELLRRRRIAGIGTEAT